MFLNFKAGAPLTEFREYVNTIHSQNDLLIMLPILQILLITLGMNIDCILYDSVFRSA